MNGKIPFVFSSVCFWGLWLCWAAVRNNYKVDVVCTSFGPIRGPSCPTQGNRGIFSLSIIHYNSPLFKLQLGSSDTLWGNYISHSKPLGNYVVCRSCNLQNTLWRQREEMELGKCFFFCTGAHTLWEFYSTNSSQCKSFLNTKEPFYCVKQDNFKISWFVSM